MEHRKTERNPLFAGRWFEDGIILLCLRWYFRFKLSYRDLVEILGERGLPISHTTILRWVVRYAETCERRWSRFERPVGGSWRVDETFIKVRGQWMYLYRAVDGQGNTVELFLSRARGIAAAKAFFRKALKHHRELHSITLDGHRLRWQHYPPTSRQLGKIRSNGFRLAEVLLAGSISPTPAETIRRTGLRKGTITQRSSTRRVSKGLGVARRCCTIDSIGDIFMQD